MTSIYDEIIDFILLLEGGVADLVGDSGGWTYKGLSSKFYPEIRNKFDEGDPDLDKYVRDVYLRDYILTIDGHKWLAEEAPWLLRLMVPAKVHGAGDEQLTKVVQRHLQMSGYDLVVDGIWGPNTLRAVQSLSKVGLTTLSNSVFSSRDLLVAERISSVGGYSSGIKNRVVNSFAFAFGTKFDSNISSDLLDRKGLESVEIAKLSIVLDPSRPNLPESDSGWEDMPIGLDLSIQIRSASDAFNIIPSEISVRKRGAS